MEHSGKGKKGKKRRGGGEERKYLYFVTLFNIGPIMTIQKQGRIIFLKHFGGEIFLGSHNVNNVNFSSILA